MYRRLLSITLALLLTTAACAQESPADAACTGTPLDLSAMPPAAGDTPADMSAETETEARAREILATDGVHVLHFWAPWCGNSIAELRAGWYDLIERNPSVHFTFVTVWNDGEVGADVLRKYAIPERVTLLAQPDRGPSEDKSQRRRQFMGLPMTWTPSTWIFHQNGKLAYAINYGEVEMTTLQHLLDAVGQDWSHD